MYLFFWLFQSSSFLLVLLVVSQKGDVTSGQRPVVGAGVDVFALILGRPGGDAAGDGRRGLKGLGGQRGKLVGIGDATSFSNSRQVGADFSGILPRHALNRSMDIRQGGADNGDGRAGRRGEEGRPRK